MPIIATLLLRYTHKIRYIFNSVNTKVPNLPSNVLFVYFTPNHPKITKISLTSICFVGESERQGWRHMGLEAGGHSNGDDIG